MYVSFHLDTGFVILLSLNCSFNYTTMTSIDFEATTCEDYNVSIQAMRSISRNLLSALLNPPKIISTDKGIPRLVYLLRQIRK